MDRGSFISKLGLVIGCLVAVAVIGLLARTYYLQRAQPEERQKNVSNNVGRSSPGWETRYNATVALARRGSDLVKGRMPVLAEMLDESQQRANFRESTPDGREVVNEVEAFQTITNGLRAVTELHRLRPDMDLTSLYPALAQLAASPNAALRTEAERTRVALGASASP
jgi:hypothetical protein